MSVSWTSPLTGQAQTGLTSPTYTLAVDTAPAGNPGKQMVVTGLGGTQTGVTVHTVASPFTLNITRPANLRTLGTANPVNGVISPIPMNTYSIIVRKGVTPALNQPAKVLVVRCTIDVPAGADTYDSANVRAALSAAFGAAVQQSAGIGDMAVNGVL
jgi:hypothetical protein